MGNTKPRRGRVRTVVTLLVVGCALWFVQHAVVFGGLLRTAVRKAPGACRRIGEVAGPEDFALDRERGLMYISSHDRRNKATLGAIYVMDVKRPLAELAVRRLEADYPPGFYPHGMSLLTRADGARRLYVVTHPGLVRTDVPLDFGNEHRVDIFAVEEGRLRLSGSIKDPGLLNPNDVYARAEDDVYITRDHGGTTPLGRFLDDFVPLSRSGLQHYDGRTVRQVLSGLSFANGVNGSADRLYVAECLGNAVHSYVIEGPGRLRADGVMALPTSPDNLEFDEQGNLWTGAHLSSLRFMGHAMSPSRPSPSQALRISPADGRSEVVYEDPGTELSASSVAVRTGSLLLIGAVFDRHIVACETSPNP